MLVAASLALLPACRRPKRRRHSVAPCAPERSEGSARNQAGEGSSPSGRKDSEIAGAAASARTLKTE